MTKLISSSQARSINALSEHAIINLRNESTTHQIQTRGLYIKCKETRKHALIEGVFHIIKIEQLDCSTIGGLNVALDEGWWQLRVSYRYSAIVARCTGNSYISCLEVAEH